MRATVKVPIFRTYIELQPAHLTDAGREFFDYQGWLEKKANRLAGGSGTFSNFAETSLLDHIGKTSYTSPATWLALCTAVPDSSKTGTTITEATYTGYARQHILAAGWNAAVSGGAGAASTKTNNGAITYAACTAGSSTIIGYAICDAVTVGNMLGWGSATSTVISTTQTPATIADQGLTLTLI